MCAGLEITFDLSQYSFTEGDELGGQPIRVLFREIKNPFTLILHPASHKEADDRYAVARFIEDPPEEEVDMATSGRI